MAGPPPLIAIIDDEESVRVALRRLCLAYGMDALTFGSVTELLRNVDAVKPDCLIVDLEVPGFPARDLHGWLREHGIDIPTILMTGQDEAEGGRSPIPPGMGACLCKPIDAAVLFAAIRTALGDMTDRDSP